MPADLLRVRFEDALRVGEGVVDRGVKVFLRVVRVLRDDELFARDVKVDPDVEFLALLTMAVRLFHDNVAIYDTIEQRLELLRPPLHVRRYGRGRRHVAEGDLRRDHHWLLPFVRPPRFGVFGSTSFTTAFVDGR
jgi:hypothetical protein